MRWLTIAALGLVACGPDPEAGAEIYGDTCAACHGANGDAGTDINGTPAGDLNERVPALSDEQIVDIILDGTGGMPPTGLSEREAEDVVAHLREKFGGGDE